MTKTSPVQLPAAAARLGALRSMRIYAWSIALDVAHRLIKRRKRTRAQVASDYDQGEWAQQQAARNWQAAPTLESFVVKGWGDRPMIALLDGHLWSLPSTAYYRFRHDRLAEILATYAGAATSVVELGSGTGSNLFALSLEPRWSDLLGLELSDTGRKVGEAVARHYQVEDRVRFAKIDLLDADSPGFDLTRDQLVFTYYVLEQLPRDTETVFRHLLAAGIRRAVMIEPSFELLSPRSLRDLASISYVWRQDYQRTIVRTARRLEREGLIRVLKIERLRFAPGWRHAPTLVVWEPV